MEGIKTSKAQLQAVKTWEDKNKDKVTYTKSKSSCKSFIKNKATFEDIEDIEKLIKEVKASKYNNL
jgi:hypothetical protein